MSIIGICNRALSMMGTQTQISSFDDGSNEATQCGLWYDELRQQLLRTAQWGFARGQGPLTQIGDLDPDGTSDYPFVFKYTYPPDALKIRYILPQPPTTANASGLVTPVGDASVVPFFPRPSRRWRFLIASEVDTYGNQTRVLLSNAANAIGVYTRDITNPDVFDPLFRQALTASLAFNLVIPLAGNVGMQKNFAALAEDAITKARVADANEAIPSSDIRVDWIETRGGGMNSPYAFNTGSNGGEFPAWGNWYGGNEDMNWGS
jgi:hypothetical protein